MKRLIRRLMAAFTTATVLWPALAYAGLAGGGVMPWDPTLTMLQNDLQGNVAHTIVGAGIIGTGFMWQHSDHGTGVRKLSGTVFGGALALGGYTAMTTLFPAAGALF